MTQPRRLEKGGRINRARPLTFTFDGRRYQGFDGDTLASALLADPFPVQLGFGDYAYAILDQPESFLRVFLGECFHGKLRLGKCLFYPSGRARCGRKYEAEAV